MIKEDDFLSWAHAYWPFIHKSAAVSVTPVMRNAFKAMMSPSIMYNLIACRNPCAPNYLRHLRELPIDDYMDSNVSLLDWTLELHNIVNDETGKGRIEGPELQKIKDYYLPSLQEGDEDTCQSCGSEDLPVSSHPSQIEQSRNTYDQYRQGTYKLTLHTDKVKINPAFRRR